MKGLMECFQKIDSSLYSSG